MSLGEAPIHPEREGIFGEAQLPPFNPSDERTLVVAPYMGYIAGRLRELDPEDDRNGATGRIVKVEKVVSAMHGEGWRLLANIVDYENSINGVTDDLHVVGVASLPYCGARLVIAETHYPLQDLRRTFYYVPEFEWIGEIQVKGGEKQASTESPDSYIGLSTVINEASEAQWRYATRPQRIAHLEEPIFKA